MGERVCASKVCVCVRARTLVFLFQEGKGGRVDRTGAEKCPHVASGIGRGVLTVQINENVSLAGGV